MKSFQTIYTSLQRRTGDDSTDTLTQFKEDINGTNQLVLGFYPWKFLETTDNITTEASTARYELQNSVRKLMSVVSTPDGGTTYYFPKPVEDANFWEKLQGLNAGASNIPEFFYQEGNDLLIWPKYSTAGHTLTVRYRKGQDELSRADYTTGTITSITNGAKALVGSSTVWTDRQPVLEQWLRIDQTTGDYRWYRVSTIGSDTGITFEKNYQGTTISAATATYTLGEFSIIPGQYHDVLLSRALALYYDSQEDQTQSARFWKLYDGGHEAGLIPSERQIGGLLKKMIDEQGGMLEGGFYDAGNSASPPSPEFASLKDINSGGSW